MILLDAAVGSNELEAPLAALGLPVEVTHLDYGDVAFMGRGEKGEPLQIGIELKTIPDLCASINTGEKRLVSRQLPGLVRVYDRAYLIVEGIWGHDQYGRVVQKRARGMWRDVPGAPPAVELEKRLLVLQLRGGLTIRHTASRSDTVRFLHALYRVWTDKDLDEHKSHLALHNPDFDTALLIPVSDFRQHVGKFPGVGMKRSKAVEEYFGGHLERALKASAQEWASIVTPDNNRRIGDKTAERIVEYTRRLR